MRWQCASESPSRRLAIEHLREAGAIHAQLTRSLASLQAEYDTS